MKKLLQTFALFAALMMSWTLHAQVTLTVANGTATNEYVPVYGFYVDEYVRAQMIYPSSMLSSMTGASVTSMTFYSADNSISWGSAAFQVKLSEVTSTTLTDWLTSTTTTVYSGALSINANGQMVVTFTTPYTYGGGNLLVEVVSTATGSYVSADFYGINSTGASIQGYDSDGPSYIIADDQSFLPKATFGFLPPSITCPWPFNLAASNITTSSADITWSDTSNAGAWRVWWAPADTLSRLDSADVYDTAYSFYGLSERTDYVVRVATLCASEESYPQTITFQTASTAVIYSMTQSIDTLVTCNALIYDNGGATGSYANSSNNTLIVRAASSDSTLILSGTLNSESNYDWLTIYEGEGTGGTQLYHQSGSATVGPFTSQSGAFTIVFSSDVSVNSAGFELFVRCGYIPCPTPFSINLDSASVDWAAISWHQNGTAYGWTVEYDTIPFIPGTNTAMGVEYVYDTTLLLQYLDTGRTYYMSIHADCGADTSENAMFQFTTLSGLPANIPYTCNFEANGTNGWDFIQEGQSNYWMVGSATHNGGSQSLYITNNGTANAYNTSVTCYSFATRTVILPDTGEYAYSFDWKAYGESSWDFLRAALVPVDVTLTAGSYSGFDNSTAVPAGSISLDGGRLNLQSGWQTRMGTFRLNQPGVYKITFFWKNDNSGGSTPPAAIDNVSLAYNTCPSPTGLQATYVSADTIIVEWNGGSAGSWMLSIDSTSTEVYDTTYTFDNLSASTQYTISVRAICGVDDTSIAASISVRTACGAITALPFIEDFTGYAENSYPACWSRILNSSSYPYITTSYGNSMKLGGGASVIAPLIQVPVNRLSVAFDLQKEGTSSGTMQFGYTFNPNSVDSMVVLQTIDPSSTYTYFHYEFDLASDTCTSPAYLVWHQVGTSNWYYWLDNVEIRLLSSCLRVDSVHATVVGVSDATVVWSVIDPTETDFEVRYGHSGCRFDTLVPQYVYGADSIYLTGLDSGMTYDVYVRRLCSSGDTSDYRMASFTTLAGAPATVPYSCNFEEMGANGWDLINTDQANYWMVGSATSNGGSRSMYITNDGSSNAYTTSSISYSYAVRVFNLTDTGEYAYSYDWKGQGESHNYDFTRVFMTPASENFTAGSILGGSTYSFATTAAPAGWIELTQSGATPNTLSQQTTWQSVNGIFQISTPGTYKMVFIWANDGSGGNNPPTAIDNVALQRNTCASVRNVVAALTADSININWSAGGSEVEWEVTLNDSLVVPVYDTFYTFTGLNANTNYIVVIRAVCGPGDTSLTHTETLHTPCVSVALPYIENFDSLTTSTSSATGVQVPCWDKIMTGTSSYQTGSYLPQVYRSTSYAHSGYYCYRLYGVGYHMLPPMSAPLDSLQLTFWDYTSGTSYLLQVGVMEGNTFVPVQTVTTPSSTHQEVTVFFGSYTGNSRIIAFRNYNSSATTYYSYRYIDDIRVDYLPTCPHVSGLISTGNTSSSVTLDWTENGSATQWEVAVETSATATPTADSITTVHPFTVNGLTGGVNYYFWVRPLCGTGDTGLWEGPIQVAPGQWIMQANQTDTLRSCGAAIYDDGGPSGQYSSNQSSYLVVMPNAPGNLIQIQGTYTGEGCCDYLSIYDGIGTAGTQLFRACSPSSGTAVTVGPFTSTSGALTIGFTSDGSVVNAGYSLTTTCITTYCRITGLQLDPTVAQSATQLALTWDTNGSNDFQVEYGPAGFTRGTGTLLTTTVNSIVIPGLTSLTSYDVYVRSICGSVDTGSWSQGTFQTTMCDNSVIVATGSESSSGTSEEMPVNNYWNYSLSETIIDSAELGGPMDIQYISYYYAYSSASTAKTNCTIYFKPTTRTTFGSTSDIEDLGTTAVRVYTGALNCSQGWNVFPLDTTYHYDGSGNLLVIVDDNSGNYDGDEYAFKTNSCTGNKTIAYYEDSYNPDVTSAAALSSYQGEEYIYNYRAVMQLISCGAVGCRQPVVTSTTTSPTSASVTWVGTSNHYEVAIKTLAAANWPAATPVTTSSYTFTGLQPATNYTFRVRQDCTVDSLGYSNWKVGYFVTDSIGCVAPTALTRTGMTNSTATFGWTPMGNETAWQMHVFNSTFDSVYAPVTATTATVSGLTAGVTYYASVRALCGPLQDVEGDWSDSIQLVTQVCPTVTGVTSSDVTFNSVTLNWNPVAMAQGYEVEYGMSGFTQGNGTRQSATTNSLTLVGLMDETSYEFYVRAVCGAGWLSENWSTPVTATTGSIVGTTYVVTLSVNNPQWGQVSGGGLYAENTQVTITATPNSGYGFVQWSDNVTTNPRTLTLTSDTTLMATFAPLEDSAAILTVSYNSEWGYVEINGRETNNYTGRLGDEVRLNAVAYDGYTFVGWSDGIDTPQRTLTLHQSLTELAANFSGGDGIEKVSSSISHLVIYPNPASRSTTISVSGANGKVRIAVVDINGREVASETLECAGDCVKKMNVDNLPQGAYFVRITGEQINLVKKLLVMY